MQRRIRACAHVVALALERVMAAATVHRVQPSMIVKRNGISLLGDNGQGDKHVGFYKGLTVGTCE